MAIGRSSGRQQDVAFGQIANDLQRAAFQFGALLASARQFTGVVNVFRELNSQLTLTNAIADGTIAQFNKMEQSVRDFALGTTFSASQSANALLFLAQAGFTTEQSLSAMTGILTLAQGSLEDVNEVADLVSSTLQAFNLEAERSGDVANLFAASMSQTLATLPKIAFAMRQVGPAAAAMGVSVEDTTVALGALFDVGLRGEQAGTALRNVMINLVSPVGEAAKIIDTLGIQIYRADGRMRDFFDILRDLSRFNLADSDLTQLFGREALSGGIALLNAARTGALDRSRESQTGTQEAIRIALEQMTSFDAQLKQAQNSVDEFRLSLGGQLAESITPILGYITDLAIAWREMDEASKSSILSLATSGAQMLVVAGGALALGKGLGALLGTVAKLATSFIESSEAAAGFFAQLNPSFVGPRQGSWLGNLGRGFAALAPAIGLATVALTAAGGFIWALKEARDASDNARLDEQIGAFADYGAQVQRSLSNLRQIIASQNPMQSGGPIGAGLEQAREALKAQQEELRIASEKVASLQNEIDTSYTDANKPIEAMQRAADLRLLQARARDRVTAAQEAISQISGAVEATIRSDRRTREPAYLQYLIDAATIAGTGPEGEQAATRKIVEGAKEANARLETNLNYALNAYYQSGEAVDLDRLLDIFVDDLVKTGDFDRTTVEENVKTAVQNRFALVYKASIDALDEAILDAQRNETKTRLSALAANGDESAQRSLLEIQKIEDIAANILDYSQSVQSALAERMSTQNIPRAAQDIISGKFLSDMLQGTEQQQQEALAAIADFETYRDVVRQKLADVYNENNFAAVLAEAGISGPDIDVEAIYAPFIQVRDAIEAGEGIREASFAALEDLHNYLLGNMAAARLIASQAGANVEEMNNAEIAEVAATSIFKLNGGDMVAIAAENVQKAVIAALKKTAGHLFSASALLTLIREQAKNLSVIANFGNFGNSEGTADDLTSDELLAGILAKQQEFAKTVAASAQNNVDAANGRLDNKGGGGKTAEQSLTDLEKFLAERNQAIIDANLELAAFGGEFDLAEYIGLRRDQVAAEYTSKIAEAKEAYADMFKGIAAGSDEYERLEAMRDRELEQLEKLRDANVEYANSAEFAARAQREAAGQTLEKYIEMHMYTGTFFEGLAAGARDYVQNMNTDFQTGMETTKEIINGFVNTGLQMFTDYFEKVATGEETLAEMIQRNLSKMLMDWAQYFAQLALQYAADAAIRAIFGIGGSTGGGFNILSLFGLGGGSGVGGAGGVGAAAHNAKGNDNFSGGLTYLNEEGPELVYLPNGSRIRSARDSAKESSGTTIFQMAGTTVHVGSGISDEDRMQLQARINEGARERTLEIIAEESRIGGMLYGVRNG